MLIRYLIIIFIHVQIKNLPKGATVIDYAYMIHTEIGNKMVAAKVLFSLLIDVVILSSIPVLDLQVKNKM